MPTETHQRHEPLTHDHVLELLWSLIDLDDGPVDPALELAAAGVDHDMALLELWDAVVEEFGERMMGEIDMEQLREPTTVGELAFEMACACGAEPWRTDTGDLEVGGPGP